MWVIHDWVGFFICSSSSKSNILKAFIWAGRRLGGEYVVESQMIEDDLIKKGQKISQFNN
jgi:hypothetical protein